MTTLSLNTEVAAVEAELSTLRRKVEKRRDEPGFAANVAEIEERIAELEALLAVVVEPELLTEPEPEAEPPVDEPPAEPEPEPPQEPPPETPEPIEPEPATGEDSQPGDE